MKRFFFLFFLIILGCKEEILHNLSEEEANRLVTHLHQAQIEAKKVHQPDGEWAISVPDNKSTTALQYLSDARAYKRESITQKKKSSLLRGREEQRFFFERALSTEIENTLISLDGVLDVRVHLNLPAKDPLLGRKISKEDLGSGSVLLVVEERFAETQENIAQLVSGASGIPDQQISVLMSRSDLVRHLSTDPIPLTATKNTNTEPESTYVALAQSLQSPSIGLSIFLIGLLLLILCFFIPKRKKVQFSHIFGGAT